MFQSKLLALVPAVLPMLITPVLASGHAWAAVQPGTGQPGLPNASATPSAPHDHSESTTAVTTAQVEKSKDLLPFQAVGKTLDNGLKVIIVPTGLPNLVSLQIPVQTGSRNEVEPGKTGFAHFFEHMMFRGTKKYPPAAYEEVITQAGARQNAYTTDDFTNYHITFAKESLEKMLEIEADRFMNLAYTEEGFRTEALAVLGEYNKNSANPINKLLEVMREAAYTTHTYKHTTMGFLKDIEAMPEQLEYSRTFFDRWYRPEYTTVMLVGDVDPATAIPLVEKYFSVWKRGKFRAEIPVEPAPTKPTYAHVPWPVETLPWVVVGFHGPEFSETEKDSVALDLTLQLHFGETSELYKKLVVEEQILDALGYGNAEDEDPSLAMVYAKLKDGKDAVRVRDQILATFASARAVPVSLARLNQAKSNLRYGFARTLDNSDTIASVLARYVRFRRTYATLNNVFKLYDSLTVDDLLASAKRYITDERLVLTTLSHGALAEDISKAPALASFPVATKPVEAAAPPKAAAAPSLPKPPSSTEPAPAIAVLTQPSPNPQLSIKIAFDVGSAADPEGKFGLAALAAAMITEAGSASSSYDEIQAALFPVAGSFGASVDREQTVFTGAIHSDNVDQWVSYALAQLTSPGFRTEDFERVRQSQKNSLVQDLRTNNDEELGKEVLQARIFAGTAYGHPTLGTVAGIESITLEDIREFVSKHYVRAKMTLGVNGNSPPELLDTLRGQLATLAQGSAAPVVVPNGRASQGLEVEIVKKNTRSTAISMGFPIEVTRAHPDFAALYLARTWLGEHRSSMSHLYQRIREVRGMNYGDYAYIEAFPGGMFRFFPAPNHARRAQIFEIWIRPVPPEQAHHAIRVAIHEFEKMVTEGLSAEDFETTRQYLSKNVFLMTSTQDQQLGYALDSRFYGTGEYTAMMREQLAKLSVDQVNAAMKKHFRPKDMHIVCVTSDAEALQAALVADGVSSIAYASAKPQELLDEDRLIGSKKLSILPEKVKIVPVEAVFSR